jgi:hypothetical protein
MKYIKLINEFLKIYENNQESLFINQEKLKNLLLKSKELAKGDIIFAICKLAYDEFENQHDSHYEDEIDWLQRNFGDLAAFIMHLFFYNGQVCNGGHMQYYENGYASNQNRGYDYSNYTDIDNHEKFIKLFKSLELDNLLPSGKKAYDIISKFKLELNDEVEICINCDGDGKIQCSDCDDNGHIDCEQCGGTGEYGDETCGNCGGDGTIECSNCGGKGAEECNDCDGKGEIETGNQKPSNTSEWSILDTQWYDINDQFMKEFEDYLKSLILDGEIIEDLIEFADKTQKYNL